MAEQKTRPHTGDVMEFLAQVEDPVKRADSHRLVHLMEEVSGEKAVLWGTMIGFGHYHYKYPTGHEGDSFLVGFAPRKAEFSLYFMGAAFPEVQARRQDLLARMGKHREGKGCIYVKKLADVDMDVVRELADISVKTLRAAYPAP
jgi:hypothetical protein